MADIITTLNTKYGNGTVIKGALQIPRISSGSIGLDKITGGGIPLNKFTYITGAESSGKTTLAIHIAIEMQKKDTTRYIGYVDMEHAFDMQYAKGIGLDEGRCIFVQPDNSQHAWSMIADMCESGQVSLIILDSIATLVTQQEIDGDISDQHVGIAARLNGQSMRKVIPLLSKNKVTFIGINQLRQNIGVIGYGNKHTSPGGYSFRYASHLTLEPARIATIKDNENTAISNRTKVKVAKSKVCPPYKECEFDLVYGVGIDQCGEVVDLAIIYKLITKNGAWYTFTRNGEILVKEQGRSNFIDAIKKHALYPELVAQVRQMAEV